MIKRLVLACAAVATASSAAACAGPTLAAPADLCALLPADDVSRELGVPITVTKRLVDEPESPWAYCLYGTSTQQFVTLAAPTKGVAGNVRVLVDPRVDSAIAHRIEVLAGRTVPAGYRLEPIDIPLACVDLQSAAEAVIGPVVFARGSVDGPILTCDFIGPKGNVQAQARPAAFAYANEMVGEQIVDEPDAKLWAQRSSSKTSIRGFVDHRAVTITITSNDGSAEALTDGERAFGRSFLAASW